MDEHGLARIVGWVSIGVGLSAIAAPVPLMRAFGMGDRPKLAHFLGVRDLVSARGYCGGRTWEPGSRPGASPTHWTGCSSSVARLPGPSEGTEHRSASPRPQALAP
jgi:hypothetical protein